jgi:biotin operon repressor
MTVVADGTDIGAVQDRGYRNRQPPQPLVDG